jgi:hypothetical protein
VPLSTNDGFKFFLADGTWLPDPGQRHRAARPRLHRGDVGGPREAMLTPASAGPRLVSDAADGAPAGRQALGPRADLGPHGPLLRQGDRDRDAGRRLSLQYHERKDESVYVMRGRLRLHLEDDAGR